ncbi:MAG: class I SAM-dependent methyltransferase [Thermoanaerobaculia bacterium]
MPELPSFEIDGVTFVLDVTWGVARGRSTAEQFFLIKTPVFVDYYKSLRDRRPRAILEIGMFDGGSMVLLDKLYQPAVLVGVDICDELPALEVYRRSRPHIRTLYRTSQDDPGLPDRLRQHFPNGIDLIVDDASHHYNRTRKTFQHLFPLLRPGGLYVIEDWQWAHQEPYQSPENGWYGDPALTNLLFDLIVNLPIDPRLALLTIRHDLAAIEKSTSAGTGPIDLDDGRQHLRGRSLSLL